MTQISPTYLQVVRDNIDLWLKNTEQLTDAQLVSLNKKFPLLKRAVKQALTIPETQSEETAVLVKQSFLLVERYGRWASWLPLINRVVNKCVEENSILLFDLLIQKGIFLRSYRQLDQAILTHQEAKKIAEALNDKLVLAEAFFNLCVDYRLKRDYKLAQRSGLKSLTLFREANASKKSQAAILNALGLILLEIGDVENLRIAEERFKESIEIGKSTIEPTLHARTMINLAVTLERQDKFEEALKTYRNADFLLTYTNSELDKSKLFNSLGTLYFRLEKWKDAESSFRKANSKLLKESEDIFTQASLNQNLGNVLLKQGRANEAEAFLREGIRLWERVDDQVWLANAFGTLGEALGKQKQTDKAIFYYNKAIALLNKLSKSTERASRLIQEFISEKENLIANYHCKK